MEDYDVIRRHLGSPVEVKLGEDTLKLPRFTIEEFADAIITAQQIETKEISEAEGTTTMLKLLVDVVKRKFSQEIKEGKLKEVECEELVLNNTESFMKEIENFMPRMVGNRMDQKLQSLLNKKEEKNANTNTGEGTQSSGKV